jgi:hypothetical protein
VSDEYVWPIDAPDLRDGLTRKDVIDALYAPLTLRVANRVPPESPTFLAVCAPTEDQRLIMIVSLRDDASQPWTIVFARDADSAERKMWREQTR